ncbi:uncharacterized protein LOC142631750 [Castanea sativa]|uniref:uncharacterized protein LOC142631750 n=1 Tax=Castanea sativa TaxID=21020 RepID=UPI003F64D94C
MADWGPVLIAVVLLTPGLLFQLPGHSRVVDFCNMRTSGVSIMVHTIIFFGLITIFLIAIGVHITTGWSLIISYHPLSLHFSDACISFFFFSFIFNLFIENVAAS